MVTGRFAPSPSGHMHLGNVSAALLAWLSAKSQGGEVVLRIEDLDPDRSRREYADTIMDDLQWLGLKWDRRAEDQSCRTDAYLAATEKIKGLIYPCYCSRDELRAASAPHTSDGRVIYSGRCRNLSVEQRLAQRKAPCLRICVPDQTISFVDGLQGPYTLSLSDQWGDFIIRRADGVAAYQLAVVVDDAANGVTEVVRGRDLLSSTPVQIWLYRELGLKAPSFYHTPMLLAMDGRRLSKRDGDCTLQSLRASWSAEKVIGLIAWLHGLIDRWEAVSLTELVKDFSWDRVRQKDILLDMKMMMESPHIGIHD